MCAIIRRRKFTFRSNIKNVKIKSSKQTFSFLMFRTWIFFNIIFKWERINSSKINNIEESKLALVKLKIKKEDKAMKIKKWYI
jgi:hypothetical protein